jgi:hypothetical protein
LNECGAFPCQHVLERTVATAKKSTASLCVAPTICVVQGGYLAPGLAQVDRFRDPQLQGGPWLDSGHRDNRLEVARRFCAPHGINKSVQKVAPLIGGRDVDAAIEAMRVPGPLLCQELVANRQRRRMAPRSRLDQYQLAIPRKTASGKSPTRENALSSLEQPIERAASPSDKGRIRLSCSIKLQRAAADSLFPVFQAEDVGNQIIHIVALDYQVRHRRVRRARPHGQRRNRHPRRIGDLLKWRRQSVWRRRITWQYVVAFRADPLRVGEPFICVADIGGLRRRRDTRAGPQAQVETATVAIS